MRRGEKRGGRRVGRLAAGREVANIRAMGMTVDQIVAEARQLPKDLRAELLDRVTRAGFIDDYAGIRISKTGKRFRIWQAVVWNLRDRQGAFAGQAASFTDWEFLP